jgi:hypothetical protein
MVAVFDCLHDMGDPVGAAAHVRESLEPEGTWMIVEPFANDRLEDNLNPLGRALYSASSFICTAGLALAGGRTMPRRAGRRGAPARRGHAGAWHRRLASTGIFFVGRFTAACGGRRYPRAR